MHQTHNTLSENIRTQSVALLNKQLAAAIDLHGQIKQAHWNVRGPTFIAIHKLFDDVAETTLEASDLLAERAAGLGGTAEGTVQVASTKSYLVPYELGVADEAKHIFAVSTALAAFGQSIREAAGLHDLGGTVRWPVLLDEVMSEQSVRHPSRAGQLVNSMLDAEPLDAVTVTAETTPA